MSVREFVGYGWYTLYTQLRIQVLHLACVNSKNYLKMACTNFNVKIGNLFYDHFNQIQMDTITDKSPTSAQCGDVFWGSCEWPVKSLISATSTSSITNFNIKQRNVSCCELTEVDNKPLEAYFAADGSRNSKRSICCISFENGWQLNQNISGTKEIIKQSLLESKCLADVIQCANEHQHLKLVVTSVDYPFHIEWLSSDWSKLMGWNSEDVLGLDCKFLHGDATDTRAIAKFMEKPLSPLSSNCNTSLEILYYNKDNTLHRNILHCIPLVDYCGPEKTALITHICSVFTQSNEEHHSAECAGLLENMDLEEVGMPLDRREGCFSCKKINSLPTPGLVDWLRLTEDLPLSLMLRYMLRSQAPIILTDRNERIVHANINWASLTGHTAAECEGKTLSSLLLEGSETKGSSNLHHDAERLKIENNNLLSSDHDANYLRYLWGYRPYTESLSQSRPSEALSSIFSSISSFSSSDDGSFLSNLSPIFGITNRMDSYKRDIFLIRMKMYPVLIGTKHFAILCIA